MKEEAETGKILETADDEINDFVLFWKCVGDTFRLLRGSVSIWCWNINPWTHSQIYWLR